MNKIIDGIELNFSHDAFIADFGGGYVVRFRRPIPGGKIIAKLPRALEPFAIADSLEECVQKVKARIEARIAAFN